MQQHQMKTFSKLFTLSESMECHCHVPESKAKRRPLPKRGQVKKRIFGGLVRAFVPKADKERDCDGGRSSDGASTATSGCTSSYEDA